MDKVNVLYCFDSKFWRMAAVSMESLLSNANPTTKITIYCMVAPGTDGHRKIKKILKSHKNGASLVWREIKPSENLFQPNHENGKIDPVQFYRCMPHRFFKDIDKILYLNNVTLIYGDLAELFNINISNYVCGAVYDMSPINDANNTLGAYVKNFSQTHLGNGPYYNNGVLLLNLKKLAEHEHLLYQTHIPLRYPAQDLLNVAFFGKIRALPLKYNFPLGAPIPSHIAPEDTAEVNAGKYVIVDCYYTWPYDREHAHKDVYNAFAKYAGNIGMTAESFTRADTKNAPVKKTFVPHITIRDGKILFFGMSLDK